MKQSVKRKTAPNIFILAPYPIGEAPSQRFRFEQYIVHLQKNGFQIYFHSFLNVKTWKTLYSEGKFLAKIWGITLSFCKRWALLVKLRKANYIFIHREAAQLGPPIFEWIIAKILRKKYIFDFDDAIWLPNYSENNERFHRLKAYWKIKYCIKWADKVSAGNEYLANFARQFNDNVEVIPTTIDSINYHKESISYNASKLTIGWTGTHTTLHYLDEIIPIIQDLEKRYIFDFIIISNEKPSFKLDSLKFIPWKKENEIQDLLNFSIGIMPLKEDQWSQGKCGFKALQYMALGIPSIIDPIGVNKTIVTNEVNGFLPTNPIEWKVYLEKLINNNELRKKIGKAGQKIVQEKFSVSAFSDSYVNLFKT